MDSLLELSRKVARIGAWFGGALIIAAAFLVGVEVVIRKAFSLSIGGADELSGYALAISTAWALAFALLERAHIRIDSLYVHLPIRLAALLDVLGLALFTGFVGLIAWYGLGVVETSYRLDAHSLSPLGTPLVLPELLWLLGFLLFLIDRRSAPAARARRADRGRSPDGAAADRLAQPERGARGRARRAQASRPGPAGPQQMIGVTLALLLGLLALGLPVAAVIGVVGLALDHLYSFLPLKLALGELVWGATTDVILVAIPMFVLLGEILLRAGIAERMYAAMSHWLSWLPGGLMHSNIGACTLFSAVSGSSVATAATIGTVAVGQIERHGYNPRFFLGTIAAGGTLGILIPPSINMIVYGVLTDTSIPQLYLAGFLPGLVLALLFMATVLVGCALKPAWGGRAIATDWRSRWRSLPDLLPPLLIFVLVIGSIYAGLATPTEAAALGVIAALALAAWRRRLTLAMLRATIEGTMRTSAMIMAILMAAYFLNFVLTSIGLTGRVDAMVTGLGLSPRETLIAVVVFYLILGMFMETLTMMVATVPIITPLIVGLGFDPVWFGVLIMLLIETAMITPPVGINLFVVQGVRGQGQLHDVMLGAAPFVITLLVMIALLILFPGLALFLPETLAR